MAMCGIALSSAEWTEVAEALAEAERARPRAAAGFRRRFSELLFGRRATPPVDLRAEALRRFVNDVADRNRPVGDLAPPLTRLGFSLRQIEAMALLSAPARARQPRRIAA